MYATFKLLSIILTGTFLHIRIFFDRFKVNFVLLANSSSFHLISTGYQLALNNLFLVKLSVETAILTNCTQVQNSYDNN